MENRTSVPAEIETLLRLFRYDAWAVAEVAKALAVPSAPPKSLKILAHIVSAERLWYERIHRLPQSFPVWPDWDAAQSQTQAAEISKLWDSYLSQGEKILTQSVGYKNTKGEGWTSRVEDILLHVITHSSYHRGQIAADMRACGFSPSYADYIHAVREKLI
jgi:uncharacterized damage-inducible protein DinB